MIPMADTADIINDITEGVDIMTEVASTEPPKAKGKKAKAKPDAAAEAQPPEAPKIVAVDGFALAAEAKEEDVSTVEAATHDAADAIERIVRKDSDLLTAYMALGRFQSAVAKMFASVKIYGQYVKAKVPASEDMDPALRSNCKWVYEALHKPDHEASDLLKVLGVWTGANDPLDDLKNLKGPSGKPVANPTVIRRAYKEAKEESARKAELEAQGINPDDAEAVSKAEKAKADSEKAERDAQRAAIKEALMWVHDEILAVGMSKAKSKAEEKAKASRLSFLVALISECLTGNKDDRKEAIEDLLQEFADSENAEPEEGGADTE